MDWIETVIIAIIEGLTEFLPVSSTGHMIIAQNLLGVPQGDPFPVWCHLIGGLPVLEALLQIRPYTCSRGQLAFPASEA